MFDTWASYESTRAFVTSSFLLAALKQPAPPACHPCLPYQQVRLPAGLRSAVRVCQLSSRRSLRRHRFPCLCKRPDQGCVRQGDHQQLGGVPSSLRVVRILLGIRRFVRPPFRHRRSHRRPHVLHRRPCLSRFLQDPPEGGKGNLAASGRRVHPAPLGVRARRKRRRVRIPRGRKPEHSRASPALERLQARSSSAESA